MALAASLGFQLGFSGFAKWCFSRVKASKTMNNIYIYIYIKQILGKLEALLF